MVRGGTLHRQQLGQDVDRGLVWQQVGIADHEDMIDGGLCAHLLDQGQQVVRGDDDTRLEVVELVLQLMLLEQGAARAHDGSQFLDPIVRHDVLRAVVHEQDDWFALADPKLCKPRCKGVACPVQLRIPDGLAIPDIGGLVGLLARMLPQVFVQWLPCLHRVTSLVVRVNSLYTGR